MTNGATAVIPDHVLRAKLPDVQKEIERIAGLVFVLTRTLTSAAANAVIATPARTRVTTSERPSR
jgi:hypothetical protein